MKRRIIYICLILLFTMFPLLIWDMKRMDNDAGVLLSLIVKAKAEETPTKSVSFRFFNQYVVLIDESICEVIGVFRAPTLKQVEYDQQGIDKIVFQSTLGFRHEITRDIINNRLEAIIKNRTGPPSFPKKHNL